MQLAELAEKEADSAGGSTEQEISGIGKQVKDLASTSQSSAKGLWDQLGNEMQKRNEAMASERKNLVQNTHQLLDKISDVTTSLGKSAGEAANKQRNLEEEMEKARRHEAKEMSAIETSQEQLKRTTDQAALWEKETQQTVGDTTATEGAMVSAVQKDVQGEEDSTSSASTKAVAAAEAQLRGVETTFETQMNRGSAQAGRDLAG